MILICVLKLLCSQSALPRQMNLPSRRTSFQYSLLKFWISVLVNGETTVELIHLLYELIFLLSFWTVLLIRALFYMCLWEQEITSFFDGIIKSGNNFVFIFNIEVLTRYLIRFLWTYVLMRVPKPQEKVDA